MIGHAEVCEVCEQGNKLFIINTYIVINIYRNTYTCSLTCSQLEQKKLHADILNSGKRNESDEEKLPFLNVQIFLLLLNEFTVNILVLILYIRSFSHLHTCNIIQQHKQFVR